MALHDGAGRSSPRHCACSPTAPHSRTCEQVVDHGPLHLVAVWVVRRQLRHKLVQELPGGGVRRRLHKAAWRSCSVKPWFAKPWLFLQGVASHYLKALNRKLI